ncbi:hypothetical protein E4T38_00184 [Aureobasidium subglaciale]|nr:hypothetical protein E4T38_00184 [Aureobasidium subglaciale]KAI5232352.1 hypothetical protein E4T40_00183 [Aureobasidium subglaciale]KAI5234673.1 hypothetical protein E4T41_00183 [Aureobasidium subglaciale]KAI5268442.1 hypothetical protein E4T46_00183 [Aureobasidium subglaciale]
MPVFPLKLPYLPVDRPVSPFFLHPPPLPPPPPTPPPPPPPSRQPDPSPYPTLCAFQPLGSAGAWEAAFQHALPFERVKNGKTVSFRLTHLA